MVALCQVISIFSLLVRNVSSSLLYMSIFDSSFVCFYRFINLASPFIGVPILPFFLSTFLGSMPYNYVCVQAGQVLGDLGSTSDILTLSLMAKLLLVSLVSLIPVFWGKSLNAKLRGQLQQQQQHRQKNDEEM